MRSSESTKNLYPALLAAKAEFGPVLKKAKSQHGKFADLAGALEATEPSLNKHGIVVTWPTSWTDGIVVLHCCLIHASTGEFLQGDWPILPVKNDPQGMGSAMTYGRRYTYLGLIGEAPEDDDGAAASGSEKPDNSKLIEKLKAAPQQIIKAVITPPNDEIPPPVEYGEPHIYRDTSAGKFIFTFGKHKGKSIEDIGLGAAQGYIKWLFDNASKDGKPLSPNAQDAARHIKAFAQGVSVENLEIADIPF